MDSSLREETRLIHFRISVPRKKYFTKNGAVCYTNEVVYTITQKLDTPPVS